MLHDRDCGIRGMISVVIPTCDRPHLVKRAVETALKQDAAPLEVIVVDDNRTEAARMKTKAAIHDIQDSRLLYVVNNRQHGGCGARNCGIDSARGEFVAFLDDDDEYLEKGLEASRSALTSNPDAVLACGRAEVNDEVYCYTWIYAPPPGIYGVADLLKGRCPISSSVVMARKTALVAAGLFDEEMPSFQDLDMWLRLAMMGGLVAHSERVAKFVQHAGVRTSVNIERRLAGLERITQKWDATLRRVVPIEEFRARFISTMYLQNGRVLLSMGLRRRLDALTHMWKAFVTARSRRINIIGTLGLALFGYHVSRFSARAISQLRACREVGEASA